MIKLSKRDLEARAQERERFASSAGRGYYKERLVSYDRMVEILDNNFMLLERCLDTFRESGVVLSEPDRYIVGFYSMNCIRFADARMVDDLVGIHIRASCGCFELKIFLKDKSNILINALWKKLVKGDLEVFFREGDNEKGRVDFEKKILSTIPKKVKAIRRFEWP